MWIVPVISAHIVLKRRAGIATADDDALPRLVRAAAAVPHWMTLSVWSRALQVAYDSEPTELGGPWRSFDQTFFICIAQVEPSHWYSTSGYYEQLHCHDSSTSVRDTN